MATSNNMTRNREFCPAGAVVVGAASKTRRSSARAPSLMSVVWRSSSTTTAGPGAERSSVTGTVVVVVVAIVVKWSKSAVLSPRYIGGKCFVHTVNGRTKAYTVCKQLLLLFLLQTIKINCSLYASRVWSNTFRIAKTKTFFESTKRRRRKKEEKKVETLCNTKRHCGRDSGGASSQASNWSFIIRSGHDRCLLLLEASPACMKA